jgi:hypothetical protein
MPGSGVITERRLMIESVACLCPALQVPVFEIECKIDCMCMRYKYEKADIENDYEKLRIGTIDIRHNSTG